jgi:hypothetical protein
MAHTKYTLKKPKCVAFLAQIQLQFECLSRENNTNDSCLQNDYYNTPINKKTLTHKTSTHNPILQRNAKNTYTILCWVNCTRNKLVGFEIIKVA